MRVFIKISISWVIILNGIFCSQEIKSQIYKHIDRFLFNKYFLAFINGKGELRDTIIGNQGLLVTYKLGNEKDACFTLTSNYDVATQDYSFMPNSLTLTLRGGNNSDQLRLRLWEDINMNRVFDSTDEVFASRAYQLGDSAWHTITFPISSFMRIAGNGNNKLDLNRIRAWDVEVTSKSGVYHAGKLYLNDLRFYSNYKPESSKEASLTGTFVTLNNAAPGGNGHWTQQKWNIQLDEMKSLNLSKIIIQYSIHQNRAWYSPGMIPFVKYNDSTINKIFAAAEKVGIKVYLGLSFSESWYKADKAMESTYTDLYLIDKENIDELYNLFGSSAAFGGWYISQEINDYDWQTKNKKALLFSWLQHIAEYAHEKDASKPVMISPFFNLWQPSDIVATWYDELLDVAKDVDWIYPQDGVGTSLKDVHIDIPNYCRRIKTVCEKHGKKFGVTVESFRQLTGWPVDNGTFSATSMDIMQLNEQIQEAYQLKPNDIILFEWNYLKKY